MNRPAGTCAPESTHLTDEELQEYTLAIRLDRDPDTYVEQHLLHCPDCRCKLQEEVFSEAVRRTLVKAGHTSQRTRRRQVAMLGVIAVLSGGLVALTIQALPDGARKQMPDLVVPHDVLAAPSVPTDVAATAPTTRTDPLVVPEIRSIGFCLQRRLSKDLRMEIQHAPDYTWATMPAAWLYRHLFPQLDDCDQVRILHGILVDAGYGPRQELDPQRPRWSEIEDLTRAFQVAYNQDAQKSESDCARLPMSGVPYHKETQEQILLSLNERPVTLQIGEGRN